MRGLIRNVKNQKVTALLIDIKQRLPALFFVGLFVTAMFAPSAEAIAASSNNGPTASDIANRQTHKTSTTPSTGTINYNSSGAPITSTSSIPAAMDANTSTGGAASTLLNSIHGKLNNPGMNVPDSSSSMIPTITPHELTDQRTATSSTYLNANGTITKTTYLAPHFYQNNGSWDNIDTSLTPDNNAADSGNVVGKALGVVESWMTSSPTAFVEKANSWQARFTPSDFPLGMVRIREGTSQVGFSPVDANSVTPVISKGPDGQQIVKYNNLWNGIDVEYIVQSDQVKEAISINNKSAASQVQFKILGANLQKPAAADKQQVLPAFNIDGALNNDFSVTPANLILNTYGFVGSGDSGLSQTYSNGILTVGVNNFYLQSLPSNAFPAVIDPTFTGTIGNRTSGTYISFETNGEVCQSNVCDPYAGYIHDTNNNLQDWRTAIYAPYSQLETPGVQLTNATLHLTQLTGVSWNTGTTATHTYQVGIATCQNTYQCMDAEWDSGSVGTSGNIGVTNIYQHFVNNQAWNGYLMIDQYDSSTSSFKSFNPDPLDTYVTFTYNDPLSAPTFITPTANQVFMDPDASFSLNTEANPYDSTQLQYEMQVTNGPNDSGLVIDSGNPNSSTLWTVPDGVLQDGSTYYIQARSYDSSTGQYSAWSQGTEFKIDTREGQDKSQTYDTVGPASVDMATGNVETNISSHTTAALGGDIGMNLSYNSPLKSRNGLIGSYWNQSGSGSASNPDLQRVDQNVNFNWNSGSPGSPISSTYFYAQWNGYFVAPTTGTYYFGAVNDDSMSISVNGTQVYNSSICGSAPPCYGSSINLTAGQPVTFLANYYQGPGADIAQIYVKGAVQEQVVPSAWFETGVRQTQLNQGLKGSYYNYTDTGSTPAIPTSSSTGLFLTRTDPLINFQWNGGSPIPNGPTSDYTVRWTGYVSVPVAGSYTFGTDSDDGSAISIAGSQIYNAWHDQGATTGYGSAVTLGANSPTPIEVDYYQHTGGNQMSLEVKPLGSSTSEVVPSNWLSTQQQVLPAGWSMGVDPDGTGSYTGLIINEDNAVLTDSSGDTYDYAWNSQNDSYTPPANSYGHLARNLDGSYTFQDSDGTTYLFNQSGVLTSMTSPVDDAHPAALQYSYGNINGVASAPVVLQKISDGVNSNRNMSLNYDYTGSTQCGTAPTGFQLAPANELCSVQTNDGRTTYFYYDSNSNLAEVVKPGNDVTKYEYQEVENGGSTIGSFLTGIRNDLANDAVSASERADDQTTYTQIQYDNLGRATSVTEPAATAGATQLTKSYNYGNVGDSWQPAADINDNTSSLASGASPVSVSWSTNSEYLFGRGSANDLIYKSWNGSNWAAWASLGGCIEGDPSAASLGPNQLTVLAEGCNASGANLETITYTNGTWSIWSTVGSTVIASAPSVIPWTSGRLDVFAQTSGNTLFHNWYSSSAWGAGENLGGCITGAPAAVSWDTTRMDVFAQDCTATGNNLDQLTYSSSAWQPWTTDALHIANQPSAASIISGQLDIVSTNSFNQVEQATYTSTNGWTGWNTLGLCSNARPSLSYRQYGTGAYDLFANNCQSGNTDIFWQTYGQPFGTTTEHVGGATEPMGYSEQVQYDGLDRTIADYNVEGQATTTQWNPQKDLEYATTTPEGQMTSYVYDDNDRQVAQYGPAPTNWFGTTTNSITGYSDIKPLSSYASQVATNTTAYDQNMTGLAVTYQTVQDLTADNAVMTGPPLLHTTNIASDGTISKDWGTNGSPISGTTSNWGFTMTGKMILPTTGTWTFNLTSDEGAQMWVNGQLIIDDWKDNQTSTSPTSSQLDTHPSGTFTNTTANAMVDVTIKYYHLGGDANFALSMTPPGGSATSAVASYFTPDYSLTTSSTTNDATYGNSTSTTNYGANPELGLDASTTTDPSGLNLTTSNTYETPGNGFLRQTSRTLPGGSTTSYSYYAATDTATNPCVSGSTAAYQGGMLKTTTDPNGKAVTNVYDNAGNIVATETNSDGWTCSTYDARGRLTEQVIPAFNGSASRTITYNFDVGGNPLVTSETDSTGTITTTTDLLGRTVSYTDANGDTTTTVYDNLGRMSSQTSAMGTETYSYNNFNNVTDEKLGSTDLAWSSYDQYGRLTGVSYPSAGTLSTSISYDPVTGAEISEADNLSGTTPGANLVTNPSFEQHTVNSSLPDNWVEDNYGTNTAAFSYPNNGHTGSYSARVDMSSYSSGDAKWDTAPMTVTPSTNYTFSDYYESNVPTIVDAKITHTGGSVTYVQIGSPAASSSGWSQATYNFTTPSDATQVTILHLIQSNGYLQIDDMSMIKNQSPLSVSDTNTLSQSGKITQDTVSNGSSNLNSSYTYDTADRLTTATIGSNTYAYGFGTQNSSCGSGASVNPNSGMDSNRTTQTINGSTTTYCYNYADQLTTSSDPTASGDTYDSHGNLTQIGTGSAPVQFQYDSSDRPEGMQQYTSSGNGMGVYDAKDANDRITYRETDNIAGWNWAVHSQDWYFYTGGNDSPAYTRNASWQITAEYISLPTGVTETIYPQKTGSSATSYNFSNLHGDTILTTDATGTNTSTGTGPSSSFLYDPFGNPVPGSSDPSNTDNASFGYEGSHLKFTETDITLDPIQMGARIYLPTIGRFSSMDPVAGGNANAYVYPGDPVNGEDVSGDVNWNLVMNVALVAGEFIPGVDVVEDGGIAVDMALDISEHASERMAERNITESMARKAITKGIKYDDAKHPDTIVHVLNQGMASGKSLYVVTSKNNTRRIVTAEIRSKFKAGIRYTRR